MSEIEDIAVVGAGGLGKEIAVLINQLNQAQKKWNLIGFFDDGLPVGSRILSIPVLGSVNDLSNYTCKVVVAIGDPTVKAAIVEKLTAFKIKFATLVHPRATLGEEISIGEGSIICAGSVLTVQVTMGKHVLVNLNSTIGHDVSIGDYSSVMPGVHISGFVSIGKKVFLGTGCAVLQKLSIGDHAIIGAGAVINKNIKHNVTAVGVPAREIQKK